MNGQIHESVFFPGLPLGQKPLIHLCDPISAPSTWWRHNEGLWLNEWSKPFPVMLSHASPQCGNTDSLKMDYKHEMYFKYLSEESNMVHTLQSSDPL